jgi:tRNA nucleotidyltransferase (CCA-adding enzyme)
MKKYIVGGAVRDKLLGKEPNDIDYVVVGSSPEEMLELGFDEVGEDFPVFLHPITRDEYALARTERKSGVGYTGFVFKYDKTITLELDLLRRDLTVNAMAIDENGVIIDPYGGQKDLKNKVLRHVSEAFQDDPLRVLRVARFCAKMPEFTIAPETRDMLRKMVAEGAIDDLKKERMWKEIEKVMPSTKPSRFFEVLDDLGALDKIFPEIKKMQGIPQPKVHHAEGDVYIHVMMVLDSATELSKDLSDENKILVRMAALFHDIGKAFTPDSLLYENGVAVGKHHGHDGKELVTKKMRAIGERLCFPKAIENFCIDAAYVHQRVHGIKVMNAKSVTNMFNELSIKQKTGQGKEHIYIDNLMMTCYADHQGRRELKEGVVVLPSKEYPQQDLFRKYFKEYSDCSTELQNWIKAYTERNEKAPAGQVIKDNLHSIRVSKIGRAKP